MHGEDLVVEVWREKMAFGMRKLQPHQRRQYAAKQKEDECGDDVAPPNDRVVYLLEPGDKAFAVTPCSLQPGARLFISHRRERPRLIGVLNRFRLHLPLGLAAHFSDSR